MGSRHYFITEDQKKEYASGVLLGLMIEQNCTFSVLLEGSDRDLEPVFVYMLGRDYLDVDGKNRYVPTPYGVEKLKNMHKRYEEYLAHFDIYCAVDLEAGIFAFERVFEMDDIEWESYISGENFVDLRIAVALYKKMNPTDIVFISFLKEGQFETDKPNWQFDLLSGLIWSDIEEIIETAVQIEDLGYKDENNETVPGEVVVEDIVCKGASLNVKLHAEEEHRKKRDHQFPNDFSDAGEGKYEVTNFDKYYDPHYISPIWLVF